DEAVIQPTWAADGSLLYVSDPTGWWNLYHWDGSDSKAVLPGQAEFGSPQWIFGRPSYVTLNDGRVVATFFDDGVQRIGIIAEGTLTTLDLGFTNHSFLATDGESRVWFVGHRADGSVSLAEYDVDL